jgi:hypothetical protein
MLSIVNGNAIGNLGRRADSPDRKAASAAPTLGDVEPVWLASLGAGLATVLINPNSRNLEIGLAFAALAVVARWFRGEWRVARRRGVTAVALFVLLLGLLCYNDPFFAYVVIAPVIVLFGGKWLLFGKDQRALALSAAMLVTLVCAKGWQWAFWSLGVHAGQGDATFAAVPRLIHNAQLFGMGALDLFNANIFGRPVWSVQSMAAELNLLILLVTLLSPLLLLVPQVRHDVWKVFFVLQPLFIALIFIGSSIVVDEQSARYLVLLPFYAALIWAVVVTDVTPLRARLVLTGALALATALNVISTARAYLARGDTPNAENQEIVRIVTDHHLTKGYASFWNAGINQYFARNKVLFIQSGCSSTTGLRPYRWLLNEQVLQRPAKDSFYLFDPAATRCTEADIERFFGQPQKTVQLDGQKRLLVYGYDISTRMNH